MPSKSKIYALVPAAGVGNRMKSAIPKQYLDIAGKPLIWYTIRALSLHREIERVYVVLSSDDDYWNDYTWDQFAAKLVVLRCGGKTRAESVLNGLQQLNENTVDKNDWIMVHDAARPCLRQENIDNLLENLRDDSVGGILAMPVADTLKFSEQTEVIKHTIPRNGIWQAQTPQMFPYQLLKSALSKNQNITDEASAIEQMGLSPKLIIGAATNFKVTYPDDLFLASLILTSSGE